MESRNVLLTVGLAALLATACQSSSQPSAPAPTENEPGVVSVEPTLAELRKRPLVEDRLEAGEPCPIAEVQDLSPALARALGGGPVYPLGFGEDGTVELESRQGGDAAEGKWAGAETRWVSDPAYDGPLVIRGRQLNGPNRVRFDHGKRELLKRLEFRPGSADTRVDGWRAFSTRTRVPEPGCYAFQIDGSDFSAVIAFKAVSAQ